MGIDISLLLYLLAIQEPSRWSKRTSKRRARTENLLSKISLPPSFIVEGIADNDGREDMNKGIESLRIPMLDAPMLEWSSSTSTSSTAVDPIYDPQQGGKLQADTPRALRKRRQVEAFAHVVSQLLPSSTATGGRSTIVDAGSGAGNLSIPLAGLVQHDNCHICAVDVNEMALSRLTARGALLPNDVGSRISTLCADLATATLPDDTAMVCSLHACGAATDMAIRLATCMNVPFCVSPCCTAKVVTQRQPLNQYGPLASSQRSAAPADISYPRSHWLRSNLVAVEQESLNFDDDSSQNNNAYSPEEYYEVLARTADVGLGPQTPLEQRTHQRLAKYAIELDRLVAASEQHSYHVQLFRLRDHEEYGKSEMLLGAPAGSFAAKAIANLATTCLSS
jgi:SAM-dependent methyltransferase